MDVVAALDAPCAPRNPSKGPEGTTSPPPLSESETDDFTAAAKVDAASHVAGARARSSRVSHRGGGGGGDALEEELEEHAVLALERLDLLQQRPYDLDD